MVGYQLDITSHTLVQVARQALDSGILDNANRLRPLALGQQRSSGRRVEEGMWQLLHLSHDVVTVNGVTLQEELERSYSQVGEEETILLTRTN